MELFEAFKALEALNEDTFSVSDDGIAKLDEFQSNDEITDEIDVIDPDAETEEDFEDSYVGKVILDCTVCHSKIYKAKEEVELNEEGTLANVGEDCPFCYTSDGFKIIGEVADFAKDTEEEKEDTEENKEEAVEESLNEAVATLDKPMSSLQGTLGQVLTSHSDELATVLDRQSALDFLAAVEPEVKNKNYLAAIQAKVAMLPDSKVSQFLYNIILKGDGMSAKLETLEEGVFDFLKKKKKKDNQDTNEKKPEQPEDNKEDDKEEGDAFPTYTLDEWERALNIAENHYYQSGDGAKDIIWDEIVSFSACPNLAKDVMEFFDAYLGYGKYAKNHDKTKQVDAKDFAKHLEEGIFGFGKKKKKEEEPAPTKKSSSAENTPDGWCVGRKMKSGYNYYWMDYDQDLYDSRDKAKSVADYKNSRLGSNSDYMYEPFDASCGKDIFGSKFHIFESFDQDNDEELEEGIFGNKEDKYKKAFNAIFKELDINTPSEIGNILAECLLDGMDTFVSQKYNHDEEKAKAKLFKDYVSPFLSKPDDQGFTRLKNVALKSEDEDKKQRLQEVYKAIINFGHTKGVGDKGLNWLFSKIVPTLKLHVGSVMKYNESLSESVNNVNVETDEDVINVATDDNGKVTVTTEPKASEDATEDGEVIAPISDETKAEIEQDETVEPEIDEFDEEAFNELGESYLKEVYENVDSFKVKSVCEATNGLIVEGVIKFNSGAPKSTKFLFEASEGTRQNTYKFSGENLQLTESKNAFSLCGRIENKKFISESLNYHYRAQNEKVRGSVKRG